MLEKIQKIFEKVTGITDVAITPNTKLSKREIDVSSFTLIQLYCELEDAFDVEIPNSAIKRMKTVADILDYLKKQGCV